MKVDDVETKKKTNMGLCNEIIALEIAYRKNKKYKLGPKQRYPK